MDQGEEDGDWMMEPAAGKKGGVMIDRKKRFSEEQIKSLESMFATQTKLEPRQKLQLARELGLQPRQVAIWFQNKRARWKSKQLERQYAALRDDYDALLSSYDQLKKDKQALVNQVCTVSTTYHVLISPCCPAGGVRRVVPVANARSTGSCLACPCSWRS